jgi:VCBS repeat-containing protein
VAVNDTYTTLKDVQLTIAAPGILANDTDVDGDALTAVLVTNVSHGILSLNTNGSFTYTPNTNSNGSDSFAYCASDGYPVILEQNNSGGGNQSINDGQKGAQSFWHGTAGGPNYMISQVVLYLSRKSGGSDNLNFSIGTGVNAGAIAGSSNSISTSSITNTSQGSSFQTYAIVYGTPLGPFIAGTTYYLNLDNQSGQKVFVEYPGSNTYTNGTFYFNGNDQNEDMRFQTYGTILSNPATVTITVIPVNDPPTAVNDTYTTLEDVRLTVAAPGILANDTDVDGDPLTAVLIGNVSHGTLALNANGGFTYLSATNYNGSDSFTYRANDGTTNGNLATVTINITPVNDAPVTVADTYTTLEDVRLTVAAPGILANDTDVDGDPLTAVLIGNVSHGTLALNANGGFTYLSATNYNGSDSFTYRANDGTTNGNLATVTINITPVNDPPVAVNDTYTTLKDVQLTIAAPGILANDTDVDGDPLTAVLVGNVSHGVLNLNTNGGFTYLSATNYNGSDSFTYRANDGTTNGNLATVTINITPVNHPPVTVNDTYTTLEDVQLTIAAPGILANDTDVDGDPLTAVLIGNVSHGTLALNANGGFTYLSATNYNGSDSFTYRANDGTTNGNLATVTINITPVNHPPVAVNDTYTTLEDVQLTIAAPGILANDTDVDGDALTAVLVSDVSNGTLNLNTNGSFTYIPNTNFNGSDSFTYQVSDGFSTGNVATVTINITPVNDPPVANDDAYITSENTLLTVPASGILTNDTDVENDPLSASLVTTVSHGSLNLNANGSFTYMPSSNYFGSDSFTYRASDLSAMSAVATVSVTVRDTHTPLSFVSEEMTASGFSLNLSAPWGYVYVVEASTNLVDWIPIFTNATLSGSVVFTDPTATNVPSQFYRAVVR